MELDHVLLWMVGLSNGLLVLRLGGSARLRRTGWFRLALLLLVALAILHWRWPGFAGLTVGPVWALFVLTPMLLSTAMRRAMLRGDFRLALLLARCVALLHPMDGMPRHVRLVGALRLLDAGRIEEAQARLASMEQTSDPLARNARVLLARALGAWDELAGWVEHGPRALLLADPAVFVGYLRALGELGRQDEMVALFNELGDADERRSDPLEHGLAALTVAAFSGQRTLVDDLLDGPLSGLAPTTREFWRATAAQVAGAPDEARALLRLARQGCRQLLLREIERREQQPLPALDEQRLPSTARERLDALHARLLHERRYAPLSGGGRRPLATLALAALLVIVFLFELPGGSEDAENLVRLGALVVPVELTPGEWWRRLSAGFLHFGPVHLLMNVAGLLLLGQWLERAWGRKRLVACFFVCTLSSLVFYPPIGAALVDDQQIVVGASGGIMGLLGALLGFLIVGRAQGRNRAVSRQLQTMLLLVGVQVLFDLSTPMVSSTAHLLGLGTGLLLGLVVSRRLVHPRALAATRVAPDDR